MAKVGNPHDVAFDLSLVESAKVGEQFFRGELNRVLVDTIRGMKATWGELTAEEQKKIIKSLDEAAMVITKQAIAVIRARGSDVALGILSSVSVKDGVKGTIEFDGNTAVRHTIMDAVKDTVVVVFPGFKALDGGSLVKPMPNNHTLPGIPDEPTAETKPEAKPEVKDAKGNPIEIVPLIPAEKVGAAATSDKVATSDAQKKAAKVMRAGKVSKKK
jgi:hypothetical protein